MKTKKSFIHAFKRPRPSEFCGGRSNTYYQLMKKNSVGLHLSYGFGGVA